MTPPDHPEAAILPVGVVERDHHVRQLIAVGADVTPVGGVLVPSEARPLARPFQVDLVGPQRDPVRLEHPAKRHDQPGDPRRAPRRSDRDGGRARSRGSSRCPGVLVLDGRVRRLHVAVPVDSVVVALGASARPRGTSRAPRASRSPPPAPPPPAGARGPPDRRRIRARRSRLLRSARVRRRSARDRSVPSLSGAGNRGHATGSSRRTPRSSLFVDPVGVRRTCEDFDSAL